MTLFGVLEDGRWRPVYAVLFALLGASLVAVWDAGDWGPPQVVVLLVATTLALDAVSRRFGDSWDVRFTAGAMPIGLMAVLLGPAPAAVAGLATVAIDALLLRARPANAVGTAFNFGVYPLLLGLVAEALLDPLDGMAFVAGTFTLIVAGQATGAAIDGSHGYLTGVHRLHRLALPGRRIVVWAGVMALVVASIAYGYREGGFGVLALTIVGLVVCQWLLLRIEAVDHALRAERDLHENYLRMVGTIVVSLDADLRVNFANRKAIAALGLPDDPVGADWAELTALSGAADVERRRYARLLDGDDSAGLLETVTRTARGVERVLEWHVTVLSDPRGAATTLLLSGEDVTEQRDATRRMAYLAYNDALTGLPNRASFDEQIPESLAQADDCCSAVALLFMDCDGFKRVNDRHGYEAGDRLLAEAAGRLRAVTGVDDLLVRRGGDEFLMLIPDLGVDAADAVGARRAVGAVADRIARAFDAPFPVASTTAKIGISVGAAIYPLDASDAAELERAADAAMYELKPRPLGGLA